MKRQRFASTCQLQYLLHTRGITSQQLEQEMREYFHRAGVQLIKTRHNKVTGWQGHLPRTRAKSRQRRSADTPRSVGKSVTVVYRRRRTMEPH